jgi:hypothetical protein
MTYGSTITMPDGAIYSRRNVVDYVLDRWVEKSGPIVPPDWTFESDAFSLKETNGRIVLWATTPTNMPSKGPFDYPTWVITDVACSSPWGVVCIDYNRTKYRLGGPWLVDGIHLENPIQVACQKSVGIIVDATPSPMHVTVKGFIANGC